MASRTRRSGWIIASALVLVALLAGAVVSWIWLPYWAPRWVMDHSPWFDPAFRAARHAPGSHGWSMLVVAERIEQHAIIDAPAAIAAAQGLPDHEHRSHHIFIVGRLTEVSSDPVWSRLLVHFIQHDPEPERRAQAISSARDSRLEGIREVLIGALADPAAEVRLEACRKLAKLRTPEAVTALITALGDPAPEVVGAACASLGEQRDPQAFVPLMALLQRALSASAQDSAHAAWEALWPLPWTPTHTAQMRRLPVLPLLGWGASGASVFRDDRSDDKALHRLDQQALLWGEQAIADLVSGLPNDDPDDPRPVEIFPVDEGLLRERACRALAVVLAGKSLLTPSDIDWVGSTIELVWRERVLLTLPGERDRRNQKVAAARRRGIDVQAALLQACASPAEAVRRYAFIALRGSTGDDVREACARALADTSSVVAGEAALTLAALGDGRAYEPLMQRLADERTAALACAGLDLLEDQRAIPAVITVLSGRLRGAAEAALTLGRIGDLRAIEPLIGVLGTAEQQLRASAALALGALGDWSATPALIALLEDEKSAVRQLAVMGLHQLRDPQAVEPLIARLADRERDVRIQAVSALRTLGDARAVEPLVALLADPDPELVELAAWALEGLGDARAADALLALLERADVGTGALGAAVDALAALPLEAGQRARLCSPARAQRAE